MKTHNLNIYHCLACGAVMHCEPEQETPQCCGRPMIKAAAETVANGGHDASLQKPAAPSDPVERKPR